MAVEGDCVVEHEKKKNCFFFTLKTLYDDAHSLTFPETFSERIA